ncbi:MAG: hypothetical protein ACRD8W_06770 [Nitrososphaeraceae archaeon]
MTFRAPKYSCTICNNVFRRQKQHFNHVMKGRCRANRIVTGTQGTGRTMTLSGIQYKYPEYIGREYNYNPIPFRINNNWC